MTSDVDPRGFAYPLEPLLKRQQWDVDALQMKLTRLQRAIDDLTSRRALTQADYENYARAVRTGPGTVLEPASYGRSLAHLAGLQSEIADSNRQLEALDQERRSLQRECLRCQLKVDITASHKEECLNEYMHSQLNRLNSERDRDWLARAIHPAQEETSAC